MKALLPVVLLFLPLTSRAAAADRPVAAIRVLVQNIYGRREKDCKARYRALAAHILAASPPYDIVALNEHWKVPLDPWFTCDADVLTRALEADGRYAGPARSARHLPRAAGPLQVSGGDSIFTLRTITDVESARFSNSNNIPLSGFVRARVELSPGVSVDFWDAHFEASSDGCSDACRLAQARELAGALERRQQASQAAGDASPVLLVGDFNTGGPLSAAQKPPYSGNGGYDDVMAALGRPRDAWLELVGSGGPDGYTYDCATDHAQSCTERERIDYVLVPESPKVLAPSASYVLEPRSIRVVRWKTPAGGDISDHYGLDATLDVVVRPAAAAPSRLGPGYSRLKAALDGGGPAVRFDGRRPR